MEKRTSQGCPLSYFVALASGDRWRKTGNTGRMVLLRHQTGVRDAGKSVLPDMVRRASCLPPGIAGSPLGQATGMTAYDALSLYRSGNKVPPCRTATETFHTARKKVFSGVGESLRGGGDSFYKKRPRPLSMMPPRQRRASLRGRPYRLRQWQGCPRSWPARRGCAWRGGPGRSR